ncbi:MAG: DinB family protein [Chloroflexi bacterium]|nr:DinB family protein [Chloroflexota bacterium]
MDIREYTVATMERVRAKTLELADGLSDEQLAWRAGPEANTIGFMLFHSFRAEDRYAHHWLTKQGEFWFSQGWAERYPLPVKPDEIDARVHTGNSWTSEQVGVFKAPPLAELLEYGASMHRSALVIVRKVDLARLGERPNPKLPEMTLLNYLQNCFLHEHEHQAHIDFVLGLMKAG